MRDSKLSILLFLGLVTAHCGGDLSKVGKDIEGLTTIDSNGQDGLRFLLKPPVVSEAEEREEESEPTYPNDDRFEIVCALDAPASDFVNSPNNSDEIPPPNTRILEFTLEEIDGDVVSIGIFGFAYRCGSAGALVKVHGLVRHRQYRLAASYATYAGQTKWFTLQSANQGLDLLMLETINEQGSVNVDMHFESSTEPECESDWACYEIYGPHNAIATVVDPATGVELPEPLIAYGDNDCYAEQAVRLMACKNGLSIGEISYQPLPY